MKHWNCSLREREEQGKELSMTTNRSPRIAPLAPPYEPEVAIALAKWMPPDSALEPLKLFRTLYHNQEMSSRMRPLGAGILGPHSSLDPREREILIDRTCARCGCEYEWGFMSPHLAKLAGFLSYNWRTLPVKASNKGCGQS